MSVRQQITALGLGCLLVVAGAVYGVVKALPLLLSGVVWLVPLSVEDKLGEAVVAGMIQRDALCDEADTRALMDAIVERLRLASPPNPYRFEVRVVRNAQVNAMAAPGGHVIVFSGLIDRMDNPEQVAAVLAHEMQHVIQRHSMKGIVRALGMQAFLSLAVGDPGILGDLAGNLSALHFARSDEVSADDGALDTLLRAGIAPSQMERAFENLAKSTGGDPMGGSLKYLSTHPPLAERITRVKERAAGRAFSNRPIGVRMAQPCAASH